MADDATFHANSEWRCQSLKKTFFSRRSTEAIPLLLSLPPAPRGACKREPSDPRPRSPHPHPAHACSMRVQQDEGHPNLAVERLLDMSSEELSQDIDRTMEAG
jgi:hypothetical protein